MRYFTSMTGGLFCYEDYLVEIASKLGDVGGELDGSRDLKTRLANGDLVEITEQEAKDLITPSGDRLKQQAMLEKEAALKELDTQSVRAMREYIVAQKDAPQKLKSIEAEASKLRAS